MFQLRPEEAAYLAGFLDGEGSFQIQRRIHKNNVDKERKWIGYSMYLDVSQTNLEILEYIKKLLNAGFICNKPAKGNRKQAWCLRIPGKVCKELARQMMPYLRVKAKIANLIIQFPMTGKHKEYLSLKDQLYIKAKLLNQRGTSNRKGATTILVGVGSSDPKSGASHADEDIV